jgi:hypothetical protein
MFVPFEFGSSKEDIMRWSLYLLSLALCGLGLPVVRAGDKSEDYLKDGKLKERLEVRVTQGGFAGFTGKYYAIEPDGSWNTGLVLPPREKKGEPKSQGKLNAKQLAQLANDLASNDLATLPNHGEPRVNPRVIEVCFGKKTSRLQLNPGRSTPEADQAIRARYAGVVQAVKALLSPIPP